MTCLLCDMSGETDFKCELHGKIGSLEDKIGDLKKIVDQQDTFIELLDPIMGLNEEYKEKLKKIHEIAIWSLLPEEKRSDMSTWPSAFPISEWEGKHITHSHVYKKIEELGS